MRPGPHGSHHDERTSSQTSSQTSSHKSWLLTWSDVSRFSKIAGTHRSSVSTWDEVCTEDPAASRAYSDAFRRQRFDCSDIRGRRNVPSLRLRLALDPSVSSAAWRSGSDGGLSLPIPGIDTATVEDAGMGARITAVGLEACVAYGTAAVAVMGVKESLAQAGILDGPACAAGEELIRAHDDLRRLFNDGDASAVPGLALSVIVLAERVAMLLE